jgi:hypothetical protein
MNETISPSELYDKDLNFLFGAGASAGLFPTLALEIQNDAGHLGHLRNRAQIFSLGSIAGDTIREKVVENYRSFLQTMLQILQRRKALERRCNVFTTNYDGCFPLVADKILREGGTDFR